MAKCPNEATAVSLKECFGLYTKAEKLGDGDAWFCPECKRKQEVVKKMGLWSLPDVLIIHLKRFRQTSNTSSNKLSTMVDCPLEGYDMSPFVTNNCQQSQTNNTAKVNNPTSSNFDLQESTTTNTSTQTSNMWTNVFSSFKKEKNISSNEPMSIQPQEQPQKEAGTVDEAAGLNSAYDLYAVCNHHGDDLQGGHYTATCRNPTDGHW